MAKRVVVAIGLMAASWMGASAPVSAQDAETTLQTVLARERQALDRWAQGDPLGYLEIDAEEITYFDDIGAQERIDGIEEMRNYFATLVGKVSPHRYEIEDPKLQLFGDVAVLTLRYLPSTLEGEPLMPWKATSVYRRSDDDWRLVHAHWSTAGEAGRVEADK